MRLQSARENSLVEQLLAFLASDSFWSALYDKFAIDRAITYTDMGIQKYLDGYEISPHPDVRKKALTFMVNINPSTQSAALDYHTHYMAFAPERDYVREFSRPPRDRAVLGAMVVVRNTKTADQEQFHGDLRTGQ